MAKIKCYIFSCIKALLKDNQIKYQFFNGGISIVGSQYFPDMIIKFEEGTRIEITPVPLSGRSYNFETNNIYSLLTKLLVFELISKDEIDNLYIRGISGSGSLELAIERPSIQATHLRRSSSGLKKNSKYRVLENSI